MWYPSFIPKMLDVLSSSQKKRTQFRRKTIRYWMTKRLRKGVFAELRAARYLQNSGLTILERNYFNDCGEIDIIAREKETIVFVEVKSRIVHSELHPGSLVLPRQKKRIKKASKKYLNLLRQPMKFRYDIIAISKKSKWSKSTVTWLRDAFY